ncbi:MAG: hypothetical protein ICV63_21705, partial [Coleofasciculus sp. Co-bin14]|nr:hypothetical protein [Coleofasciculus sp. Co-bin14]
INYGLSREGLGGWKQDLVATVMLFALLAVVLTARKALGFGLPIDGLFEYYTHT